MQNMIPQCAHVHEEKQNERNSTQNLFPQHVLFLSPFVKRGPTNESASCNREYGEATSALLPEGGMTRERTIVLGRYLARAEREKHLGVAAGEKSLEDLVHLVGGRRHGCRTHDGCVERGVDIWFAHQMFSDIAIIFCWGSEFCCKVLRNIAQSLWTAQHLATLRNCVWTAQHLATLRIWSSADSLCGVEFCHRHCLSSKDEHK